MCVCLCVCVCVIHCYSFPQHEHKVDQMEQDFSLRTAQHNEVNTERERDFHCCIIILYNV